MNAQPTALTPATSTSPKLSTRGMRALIRPPLLRCALFECQYSHDLPSGLINLGVAENSLMTDWLIAYFQRNFRLEYSDFTYGSALGGSLRLFAALRHLFSTYFHSRLPVLREHVIAGSGCGSVIDLLVSCLADAGDGILVSRPFYNGFGASFECRDGVYPVGVELPAGEEASESALVAYERVLEESNAKGVRIRAVMLCNPHNPLGFCYTKEVLLAYCRFAEKHDLHLICDEIYALSTFETPNIAKLQKFVSILSLDPAEAGCNPARIHCIYGASKDWGANGLRIGALISQANPELHTAMESSCLLMKISSPADALWSGLLLDPIGLPEYIVLNQARLATSYTRATQFLNVHHIPFRPSNAGHFIWIDLRAHLPTQDVEGKKLESGVAREEELAMRFTEGGVNVARGSAYSHPIPGFFRLTFTLRQDYFELGLSRMEKVLGLPSTIAVDLIRVPSPKNEEAILEQRIQAIKV